MSFESDAVPVFAGHQTFHPRFGWLKKGLDAVCNDPEIFSKEDAPVILGVGKNMVESIRFWCQAFKVIVPNGKSAGSRSVRYAPTVFGKLLLGDEGLDPYLEDSTSLWLLHWMLCSPKSSAPVWWLFVNEFNSVEFSDATFLDFLSEKIQSSLWKTPSTSSLTKDVDSLLRMYTRRTAKGRQTIDDLLDSPFRDLGLIQESATKPGFYRLNLNAKPTLTSTAVALATLDFMSNFDSDSKTISLTRLAYEDNSPGKVFRIPLDVLAKLLEDAASKVSGLKIASPGGVQQLVVTSSTMRIAEQLARTRYLADGIPKDLENLVGPTSRTSAHESHIQLEVAK